MLEASEAPGKSQDQVIPFYGLSPRASIPSLVVVPEPWAAMTSMHLSSSAPASQTPTSSLDPDRIYFSICPTDGPSKPFEIMASVSLGQLRVGDTGDKAEKAAISQKARTHNSRVLGFGSSVLLVEGQRCSDSGRVLTSSGWTRGLQSYKPARPSSQGKGIGESRAKSQPRLKKSFRTKTEQRGPV